MQTNQQNQMQNQQQMYQQAPPVLTTKDALYMNDMLAWNLLAMKKAHFLAEHCQDQTVKQEIEQCGMMHQKHYQQILHHLGQGVNQQSNQTLQ
ncbi:hypothetical protein Q75_12910 [Bacillus coahuilensis p1.1.43]|uniref:Uncharacterized protein n=1 Tax=Bacillus coahuilensis p1.1.43 TaxID=1150625 RepID=A0A147K5P5_9BACI|nr:hypothetical protein [Bacillus coahuilensis]KUP05156.1 hypothetical protein Q75_12910 [Bacillus coahuilensis p1.1.43]